MARTELTSFLSVRLQVLRLLLFLLISTSLSAQITFSGSVLDDETGEGLIGASVAIDNTGTVTDFNGDFSISLKPGEHSLVISYVGYEAYKETLQLDKDQKLDFRLGTSQFLKEITVTADIARERETPVAFSNIPTIKLEEELASQDLPTLLNSTPGAYATQSGGGDGDARISIRGFNQRNVAVMLNGIPVNDMENGRVFWSNWFGLDLVTKTLQVQRGLGASKLAIPSVGGTINILTQGIDSDRYLKLKQELGNNGFTRSTVGFNSGRLNNGWGYSLAGSYKKGDGWVSGTFTEGFFYYARVDKEFGKHTLSFTGFGAPQRHGQRPWKTHISQWDSEIAMELDVPEEIAIRDGRTDLGLRYNEHVGTRDGEIFNTRQNFYHKPQLSLRHSWQASDRFFLSNVTYLSIGNGGATELDGGIIGRDENGLIEVDKIVELNQAVGRSETILRSQNNDHFWYGLLSTFKYDLTENFELSGGLDLRQYRGDHFAEVEDLLGGTHFRSSGNLLTDQLSSELQVGDKYDYNNSGFVRWAGAFSLLEYKRPSYSLFLSLSSSVTGYKQIDHFKPLAVELPDTTFYVDFNREVEFEGVNYTIDSPEANKQEVGWIDIFGYSVKLGGNYKLTEKINAFLNLGLLSHPQQFRNVINTNRNESILPIEQFEEFDNEEVQAVEFGASYQSSLFSINLNTYRTEWKNRPLDNPVLVSDPQNPQSRIPLNVSGINALHMGIELDAGINLRSNLKLETLLSLGDWRWTSSARATFPDGTEFDFDATDVPVGDAAQYQAGATLRYEPIRGLYFKPKWTFFDRNFADFNPTDLTEAFLTTGERIPWQLPSYSVFDFHMGYGFKVRGNRANVRLNVLNVMDNKYISDAQNNDRFNEFNTNSSDANSATVFFGQGRRWTTSFEISF